MQSRETYPQNYPQNYPPNYSQKYPPKYPHNYTRNYIHRTTHRTTYRTTLNLSNMRSCRRIKRSHELKIIKQIMRGLPFNYNKLKFRPVCSLGLYVVQAYMKFRPICSLYILKMLLILEYLCGASCISTCRRGKYSC